MEQLYKVNQIKTKKELRVALSLRKEVFVNEQKVPISLEIDNFDTLDNPQVFHYGGYYFGELICYIRVIKFNNKIYLTRVLTKKKYRKHGFNSQLLRYVIKNFQIKNIPIILNSQVEAIRYYQKNGFIEYGKFNVDANILHKKMIYVGK